MASGSPRPEWLDYTLVFLTILAVVGTPILLTFVVRRFVQRSGLVDRLPPIVSENLLVMLVVYLFAMPFVIAGGLPAFIKWIMWIGLFVVIVVARGRNSARTAPAKLRPAPWELPRDRGMSPLEIAEMHYIAACDDEEGIDR